ncbi:hypothetical protein DFS33DRAFT_149691 [Desarmillaria ectypa]|nr:hypothetical protein DFS33DRAFT_149691 [Desarmillaria ectypa]
MGLQRETAGRGRIAVYTQITFVAFAERIFFHSKPQVHSVSRTIIIISSALYVTKKRRKQACHTSDDDIALEEGPLNGLNNDKDLFESAVPVDLKRRSSRNFDSDEELMGPTPSGSDSEEVIPQKFA